MSLDSDYKGKERRSARLWLAFREPGTRAQPLRVSPGERDSGRRGKMWRRKGLGALCQSVRLSRGLMHPPCPATAREELAFALAVGDLPFLGQLLKKVPFSADLTSRSLSHKITPNWWTIDFKEEFKQARLCREKEKDEPQPHTNLWSMNYPQGQTYHE